MPRCLDCCRKMNRDGCAKCPSSVPLHLKVGDHIAKLHKENRDWLEQQSFNDERMKVAQAKAEARLIKRRDRQRAYEMRSLSRAAKSLIQKEAA